MMKWLITIAIVYVAMVSCDMKNPKVAESKAHKNRLALEKSPYLLQHATNPVDWFAWRDEAFEKAKKEDKPIFLSIGYSTCHWCHVMEHESFEDEDVAATLNKGFVSIKVDREERPDIDNIYMTVCQAMTGRGGWPMTIIMTPDKKPFFAGTYFSKEHLISLLNQIDKLWKTERSKLLDSASEITKQVFTEQTPASKSEIGKDVFEKVLAQTNDMYDKTYAGFGGAPKFPTPHKLSLLLRIWKRTGDKEALDMVEKTLTAMRLGGIYDQVGFGFHRYSTDAKWLVPHFEKMLYDQAMLAIAYIEAYQATGNKFYADTAREIFTYVLRDMTSPEGGFYSAEDADSEGVEGKFYLWTKDEILKTLGKEDGELVVNLYNVQNEGNFEGSNILHLSRPVATELKARIERAREKLFAVREGRIHPHKDDKVLADWNGLMIVALAKGSAVLGDEKYAKAAGKAVDFILNKMRRNDGRLLHRWRDGEADILAYLDDYAFLTWGLAELYEATFDERYLKSALALNSDMLKYFWDGKNGGFYLTGSDAEQLIARTKDAYDGAIPSGNSVACLNLLRLGRITMDKELESKASESLKSFSTQITTAPLAFTQFLCAFDFYTGPTKEIVIAGERKAKDTADMISAVRSRFLPNKIFLFHSQAIEGIVPFIKEQVILNGKATAYVCENYSCNAPTNNLEELKSLIK